MEHHIHNHAQSKGRTTDKQLYSCEMCDKKLSCKSSLKAHILRHFPETRECHTCSICEKQFPTFQNLTRHINSHLQLGQHRVKCELCGAVLKAGIGFERHMLVHTGIKNFKCMDCGKLFYTKGELNNHEKVHSANAEFFACDHCDKKFLWKSNFTRHLLSNHGQGKKRTCEYCSMDFNRRKELVEHMATHTGEKSYECKTCSRLFENRHDLKIHMKTHPIETPYKCEYCGKCFRWQNKLRVHIRTHTGEKPFSCQFCDTSFYTRPRMLDHLKVHTNEKYCCKHCPKEYSTSSNLRTHIKSVHGDEMKWKCTYENCSAKFDYSCRLKKHIEFRRAGKTAENRELGKKFETGRTMKLHKKTNTPLPFKCAFCSMKFKVKLKLNTHLLIVHKIYASTFCFVKIRRCDNITSN